MSFPTKAQWKTAEASEFTVRFEDGSCIMLRLDQVVAKPHLDSQGLENYALYFSAPDERQLLQSSFWIDHPELGLSFIFLVPIGRENGRFQYEAVFNVKPEQALAEAGSPV